MNQGLGKIKKDYHKKKNNFWLLLQLNSLGENNTWKLVDLPSGKKSIGSKWVFKIKYGKECNIEKYKARLVAKGYSQKHGEDYDEVFAPVVTSTTVKILLIIAATNKLKYVTLMQNLPFWIENWKKKYTWTKQRGFTVNNLRVK